MRDLITITKVMFVEKRDIVISILCGFIAGITAIGLFALSGYLISKSALVPPIYTLMILVASVKILGIISALSRYGERYFSHRGTFTMLSNLRVSFYERLEPLAPTIFHKYRSGDLLSRIVGDVETLQNFFLRVFYPPIVLLLVFLCAIFFTVFFSIEITWIILVGFILTTFIFPAVIALRQRKVERRVRENRGELSTEVSEFLFGFRDLKIYQKLEMKESKLRHSADVYLKEQEHESVYNLFSESSNTFLSLVVSFTVLGYGAYLVSTEQLDGIFLAMLVMVSLTAFENISPMSVFPSYLEDSRQAATRLNNVVGMEEEQEILKESKEKLSIKKSPYISVNEVSFAFPNESRNTLSDITFTLPPGSKTAIVGPSGSGKSTLMQLLLQIYPVNQGEICINNKSMNSLSQESIWKSTNVVLQKNHFFYGTIRENLMIAKNELSDEEMENALEKVKLHHFSLNDQVLEKGENLSGGEQQRLAIARVLLKKAPIWLLDEPTSSIDALTEKHIYDYLFEEAKENTVVLISHRLTGLESMDQIIVMESGRIVEVGTFDELMEKKGYFYEMKQIEQSVFLNV
ncbi:thiol reductant ABC exporter subunit CydC [Bacilli bacterium]|nr:ABC transporter ATP-binding protein [Bacilli bacterium VT-13-104]PZD84059.1 thiol reductant ABC exporter subunit CydC [Bacilli bacterium]PZD84553.1 thiol reductant ABC exporter subunit CydC [Bacilli bacterium]PZD86054.1 thiol reductant ABC exporter subunit CydC [Bacilli bacterium]RCO04462.1 thiol reductant ABC exporter subunit CydC [Bacilli bacterium]